MKNLTTLLILFLFLCNLALKVYGAFEEVPKSQLVSDGDSATFRCRHGSADAIRWRVDHALISANPSPDITPNTVREGGHVVHTLTIVVRPEYNGTVVECVATFDDHSPDEQTAPALLHVLVVIDNLVGQFIEVPSSLNLTYGETAVFVCRHQSADHIKWEVTPRWRYNQFEPTSIGGKHSLSAYLEDGTDYNATTVQCMALFDHVHTLSTEPAILLVQEPLDPIGDLQENKTTSTLSWAPPPSLDLTNADPDVAYCVDVYNITCGMRDHIISDCNVTEPSYTRQVSGDGFIYEHVVTPRSNVRGAANGTSQSLKDKYHILNSSKIESLRDFEALLAISIDSALNQSLPSLYTLSLESVDVQTDCGIQITADKSNGTIYFNLSNVPPRRLFTCKIHAYGCTDNSSLLATFELSTHDVQNLSVVAISDGILIEGHYIDNSEAKGLLVIVYNTHDSTPQYYLIPRRKSGPKRRKIHYRLTEVGAGEWSISVFVVEKDRLPFSRVATPPMAVFIPNSSSELQPRPSTLIEYNVQLTSDCVHITCHFKLDTSATDCLVVVHQQLTKINLTSGLMNIEANWTQRFTRQGDMASGCIQGVDLELYQVGVANGRKVSVRSAPKVYTPVVIALIVVGLFALVTVTINIALCIRIRATITITDRQAVSKKSLTVQKTANRNKYVDLPTTHEESNKQVGSFMDMDTYTSTAIVAIPLAQCEDGDSSTDGCSGMKDKEASTPLNIKYQTLNETQYHDSSGIISQELHPSDLESDDVSPFSYKPIEVMDHRIKTEADLNPSMESITPDSLIQTPIKDFYELPEKPCLPEPKETSPAAHKVYQPVTAQPLPHNQLGDEVVLPRVSSLEVRQGCTETKDQVGVCGIDTDANELVTGVGKSDEDRV